jgi:hypothetical protein
VIGEREADKQIVADVAHEVLLRAWPRLSNCLREECEFLIFKSDAERAERRGRDWGSADRALLTVSTSREPRNGCPLAPGIYRLEVIVDDFAHSQQPLGMR